MAFEIVNRENSRSLISECMSVHSTSISTKFVFLFLSADPDVSVRFEKYLDVTTYVHRVEVTEDEIVFQQLNFIDSYGASVTLTFDTNLDFLQFCQFVGLDLLPLSAEDVG